MASVDCVDTVAVGSISILECICPANPSSFHHSDGVGPSAWDV